MDKTRGKIDETVESPLMHRDDEGYVTGFDVIVERVVGTVSLDGDGQFPPHVAAFVLIAEADEQGVFKYPMRDGRTCVVDVTWEGEAR